MLAYFHKLATASTAEERQLQITQQHAALCAHAPSPSTFIPPPKRKVGRPRKVRTVDQALADGAEASTHADGTNPEEKETVSSNKRGPYNNWSHSTPNSMAETVSRWLASATTAAHADCVLCMFGL